MKKIIEELEKRAEEAFKTSVFEAGVGTGFMQSAELVRASEGEPVESAAPPQTHEGAGQALTSRQEPALIGWILEIIRNSEEGLDHWTVSERLEADGHFVKPTRVKEALHEMTTARKLDLIGERYFLAKPRRGKP